LIVPVMPLSLPRPFVLAVLERLELLLAGFARPRLLELFARVLPLELALRFCAELDRLAAVPDPLRAVLDGLRAVLDGLRAVPEAVRVPEVLDWAIRAFPFVREPSSPGHTQRARHERSGKNAPVQA
jgi:hypothetical protein